MNGSPKKIVLISSGQPSLNPRLVKEADSLAAAGYNVTVLYAYWNAWGTELDKSLLPSKKWKAICVGGDPLNRRSVYFFSRLIHRSSVRATTSGSKMLADLAIARSSYFLKRAARKQKADLYIGHNLGALSAAVNAALKNHAKSGFDAEDLHRFEMDNNTNSYQHQLTVYLEDKYIPQLDYLTTSSPQTSADHQQWYKSKKVVTLLNVFPIAHGIALPITRPTGPVKLFWFSQTIGRSRGLEDCINALPLISGSGIELHLLGSLSDDSRSYFDDLAGGAGRICYHPPVAPDQLAQFAAQFDIGLALEPGFSKNNDNALSNKIFTYMQAGLAIIASDTTAQSELLAAYPECGKIYEKGNFNMLASLIRGYTADKETLLAAKKASYTIARRDLNWEKESEKFLKIIAEVLWV